MWRSRWRTTRSPSLPFRLRLLHQPPRPLPSPSRLLLRACAPLLDVHPVSAACAGGSGRGLRHGVSCCSCRCRCHSVCHLVCQLCRCCCRYLSCRRCSPVLPPPPPPSSTVRRPCRFYCRRGWGAGGRHGRGHCERGRLFLAAAATATAAAATASANATPTTPAAAIAAATGASVAVPLRSFADGHLLTLATAEGGVPTLPLTNAARTAVSDNVGGRHVGAGRRRCNWLFVGARSDFGGAGADSQGRRKRVPPLGKVVALGGEGRAGERRGDVVHGIRGHRGQRRGGHASY